jgi:hypothetical protein
MKRSVVIGVIVGMALLTVVIAIAFVPAREPVSLTLMQYHRWPHGATLKLTNNSKKNIGYLTDLGGYTLGAYTPILFCQKTENGWTNTSPPISPSPNVTFIAQPSGFVVGSTNKFYSMGIPGTNAGFMRALQPREIKPGRSAELYVSLEPDGPPIRVGTVCIIPQGKLAQQFGQWMVHIKRWCYLKSNPPGQVEVWCNEPLQVSSKPTHTE